jgi:hypothetical protein
MSVVASTKIKPFNTSMPGPKSMVKPKIIYVIGIHYTMHAQKKPTRCQSIIMSKVRSETSLKKKQYNFLWMIHLNVKK